MAFSALSHLLRRPAASRTPLHSLLRAATSLPFPLSVNSGRLTRSFSANPLPQPDPSDSPIPSLSARLSFVFDQIDAIDRDRGAKDEALQRIRAWRQSRPQPQPPPAAPPPSSSSGDAISEAAESGPGQALIAVADATPGESIRDVFRKEVELVHPWPEWIELMERLAQQNYFDLRRTDEDSIAENVSIDLSGIKEETGFDFSRDWTTVRNACMNFGRDRFDILRSLSRKDLQILVGHGCPSMDPKVVFSAKLLRKLAHIDEGDVCSSCNLRSSCSRGYILTLKEDVARTLDVMRILLTYAFDHVNEMVENKPLAKMKSIRTVVRKLLHEVVKLSAVPIDPNLPRPVIQKPPLKVKQPPPPPKKKRIGRDDVEMKKGDWLCTKCDFMNFAKNTVCLQCDAKRPKRQLLPGEWECPQCNFLNYRRNMACFHCDVKRPPDEYTDNQEQERQSGPRTRLERPDKTRDVPNAWNFDFDDNESDGADVAAFEFADSRKKGEADRRSYEGADRGHDDDLGENNRKPIFQERGRYFKEADERNSTLHSNRTGFDDFDDEEDDDVDSYELDGSGNQASEVYRRNYSELEETSESEDFDESDRRMRTRQSADDHLSDSDDEKHVKHPYWRSSNTGKSMQRAGHRGGLNPRMPLSSDDDDDDNDEFGSRKKSIGHQKSPFNRRRGSDSDMDDEFHGSDNDDDEHVHKSARRSGPDYTNSERQLKHTNRRLSSRRSSSADGFDERPPRSPRMQGERMHRDGSGRRSSTGGFDERPPRSPRMQGENMRRDGSGRSRDSNGFRRFDRLGAENRSGFDRRRRNDSNMDEEFHGSDYYDDQHVNNSARRSGSAYTNSGRQFKHTDRRPSSRRSSSAGGFDERPPRSSRMQGKNMRRDESGRSRDNNEFQRFDRPSAGNGSGFRRQGNSRGSPRN